MDAKTGNAGFGQRWAAYQPSKTLLVWSCLGTAAAAIVVGFVWGGWVTGGTARAMAATAADEARYELVAGLCVERFKAAEDVTTQLEALGKVQGWSRGDFIEKGGWTAVAGQASMRPAANRCAERLLAPQAASAGAPVTR